MNIYTCQFEDIQEAQESMEFMDQIKKQDFNSQDEFKQRMSLSMNYYNKMMNLLQVESLCQSMDLESNLGVLSWVESWQKFREECEFYDFDNSGIIDVIQAEKIWYRLLQNVLRLEQNQLYQRKFQDLEGSFSELCQFYQKMQTFWVRDRVKEINFEQGFDYYLVTYCGLRFWEKKEEQKQREIEEKQRIQEQERLKQQELQLMMDNERMELNFFIERGNNFTNFLNGLSPNTFLVCEQMNFTSGVFKRDPAPQFAIKLKKEFRRKDLPSVLKVQVFHQSYNKDHTAQLYCNQVIGEVQIEVNSNQAFQKKMEVRIKKTGQEKNQNNYQEQTPILEVAYFVTNLDKQQQDLQFCQEQPQQEQPNFNFQNEFIHSRQASNFSNKFNFSPVRKTSEQNYFEVEDEIQFGDDVIMNFHKTLQELGNQEEKGHQEENYQEINQYEDVYKTTREKNYQKNLNQTPEKNVENLVDKMNIEDALKNIEEFQNSLAQGWDHEKIQMNKRINNPFENNLEKIATPEKEKHDKLLRFGSNSNKKKQKDQQGQEERFPARLFQGEDLQRQQKQEDGQKKEGIFQNMEREKRNLNFISAIQSENNSKQSSLNGIKNRNVQVVSGSSEEDQDENTKMQVNQMQKNSLQYLKGEMMDEKLGTLPRVNSLQRLKQMEINSRKDGKDLDRIASIMNMKQDIDQKFKYFDASSDSEDY